MMEQTLIFVYGTLRRSASGAHHPLLGRAAFAGNASWRGRLYLVADYPGAVPDDTCGAGVGGELYLLADPEADLAALDAYEECGPAYGPDAEYVRSVTRVTLADASVREAWIYLYNRPVEGLERLESGDFCQNRRGA